MVSRHKRAWLALVCLTFFGLKVLPAAAAPPVDPNYQVFAFNDLGMHCYDKDFSVFSLLPLFNVIHGQVIYKGGTKPVLLNDVQTSLTYAATVDPSGSINTTSIGKTNFWNYLLKLFGLSQPPDTGILGYKRPCMACHGQDLKGTLLSRAKDDRTLPRSKSMGGDVIFTTGTQVSCYACHTTIQFGANIAQIMNLLL